MRFKKIKLNYLLFITFFLISVLPILIIALASYRIIPNNIKANAISKNEVIAQAISERIQEILLNSQNILILLLKNIEESKGNSNILNEQLIKHFPIFGMVQLTDQKGIVKYTIPKNENYLHSDLSRQPLFEALTKKDPFSVYWSEVFMSPETGHPTITVGIKSDTYNLIGYIDLNILHDIVRKIHVSSEGYVMITDKNGIIIAHKDYKMVKEQRHFNYKEVFRPGKSKISSTVYENDQQQILGSMVISQMTDWPVIVQQPLNEVYNVALELVYTIAIVLIAIMLSSLLLALILFSFVTKPIDLLVYRAKEIEKGNYLRSKSTNSYYEMNILEHSFHQMSKAIEQREKDLSRTLGEKNILMREINHRVKNNLIMLYSLFELQQSKSTSIVEIDILKDVKNRIQSIALIHKMLYQSELYDEINLSDFITEFRELLLMSFDRFNVDIVQNTHHVIVDITKAIPCGLIFNELVSNSIKHAFEGKAGKIEVTLFEKEDLVTLSVSDNGVGLPDDFDINTVESLGLNLVKMMTEQIEGNLEVNHQQGTSFSIQFKIGAHEKNHHS